MRLEESCNSFGIHLLEQIRASVKREERWTEVDKGGREKQFMKIKKNKKKKNKVSCRRDLKAKTLYIMTLLSAHLFVPPLSKFLLLSHYILSTFAPE